MKPDREFSARFLRFHMTAISRKIGIFVSVMEKIRFVALIFCLSFLYAICDAQELTPVVSQFDKEDYMAANQNWAVSQDTDGIMYFGNGEGLLAFDGILWTLYNLPHNKIARSVMADGDRIYVGSYEEFGFFRKCDNGTLEYESLSSALTGYEMQKTLKGFQGRYYNDIVKAKKAANGNFKVFSDKVEAMYVEYQADIAEYEASKAEQAEEEKGEEDAPAEETPVE